MFRFTIRELALFTIVVGLAISWRIDRSRLAVRAEKVEVHAREATKLGKQFLGLLDALVPDWRDRVNHDGNPVIPVN